MSEEFKLAEELGRSKMKSDVVIMICLEIKKSDDLDVKELLLELANRVSNLS